MLNGAIGAKARRGAILLAVLSMAGCEATFHPMPPIGVVAYRSDEMMPVSVVPPDIWAYPRIPYGGSYVYLVDGHWYHPTPNGWMVLRREPIELSRERTRIRDRRNLPRSTNLPPPTNVPRVPDVGSSPNPPSAPSYPTYPPYPAYPTPP